MSALFSRRACSPIAFSNESSIDPRRAGSPAKRKKGSKLKKGSLLIFFLVIAWSSTAFANPPSPQDISKSFENSFDQKTDPHWMVFGIAAAAALLMVLALLGMKNQRGAAPKALNHQGKLMREIRRQVALKSSELKQLKLITEHVKTADDRPLLSPITLLLCPSLLVKSVPGKGNTRVNRRVLGGLVRKLQEPVRK